jgi:hypothetical protein
MNQATERPFKTVKVSLLTRERRHGDYSVRLLEEDEYERVTADQLRAMIDELQTEPWAVMEQDGTLRLVNSLYRGHRSQDIENHEEKVRMFDDGTFELIEGEEEEEQTTDRPISRLPI